MLEWMKLHPIMTFLLAGAVIGVPASIVGAMRKPAELTEAQKAAIERDKLRQLSLGL